MIQFLCILLFLFTESIFATSVYDFNVKDIKGNNVSLSSYKGSPILIVNVASKCGYTYQYAGLEKLFQKYKARGLKIIGFPANNFGQQEPGSNEEIATFCKLKYDVSFPMMSKISVKGEDKHSLYKYLTEQSSKKGEINWNFEKFLIDKSGNVIERFESSIEPESEKLQKRIESIL